MKSTHPFLINYRLINVNWNLYRHLNRNLYFALSLYNFLLWIVDIDRFVDIDWLINVDWLVDIYRFLDYCCWSGYFHLVWYSNLIWHFFLYLYYLLHDSLWTMYELRDLNSDFDGLFDNNLFDNLFGHFPILIFKLLSEYINLHAHFIIIALEFINLRDMRITLPNPLNKTLNLNMLFIPILFRIHKFLL